MQLENVKLNIDTQLVLNIGSPIGKTNAPRAYNKLFEVLDMNAIMLPVEVKKGTLAEFLDACKMMGVRYLCPTMPHKADIIPLLDDVDSVSKLFHSVNAVYIDDNGISHGAGMDGKGAVRAIESSGAELDGISALMYGAGSISGVIGYELSQRNVKKLFITNRSLARAEQIAGILRENTAMEVSVIPMEAAALDAAAGQTELLLNVTPLGMCGFPATHDYLGFVERLPDNATVFDCIINPPQTDMILAAQKQNLKTVPGMQMLASQMDVIFNFMFGIQLNHEHKQACINELCDYLHVART